jgi:hypothetical protein
MRESMIKTINKRFFFIKIASFCSIFILLSGCVTNPDQYAIPPPLSKAVREELGTVGIVSAGFVPKAKIRKLNRMGAGAASGSGKVAAIVLEAATLDLDPYWVLIILPLLPIAAGTGAIAGTLKGMPDKQIVEAENAINKAIVELKIQASMSDHILRVAQQRTSYRFVRLNINGPEAPGRKVDYSFLKEMRVDTVFEITVPDFGLWTEERSNSLVAFFMNLHARLIRVTDGFVLYEQKFKYQSGPDIFTDWAANEAKPLREEFDYG